jgi:hypothetical protein
MIVMVILVSWTVVWCFMMAFAFLVQVAFVAMVRIMNSFIVLVISMVISMNKSWAVFVMMLFVMIIVRYWPEIVISMSIDMVHNR